MTKTFSAVLAAVALIAVLPSLANAQAPGTQEPGVQPARIEFRPVAEVDYDAEGVKFDLDAERERLVAWLAIGENRDLVERRPEKIRLFNWLAEARGGPIQPQLRWYPHSVRPSPRNDKAWDFSFSHNHQGVVAVPLFDGARYDAGPKNRDDRLVELLPVNMHADSFDQDDLDAASLRAGDAPDAGGPAVFWEMRADRVAAYREWTAKLVKKSVAIIVDETILSAPTIMAPIAGRGVLVGAFSREEAERLAASLKAGITPELPATKVSGADGGVAPAGSDPEDLRAMQSAQAMLAAEKRLRDLIRSGKIEGVERVLSFEEISSWPYEDGLKGMPKPLDKLDGKNVLMTGFMLPIDEVENIKEFLLVQSLWSCCYGQPPDINGIVRVVMKGDARIDYQFDPIKIMGTFKIDATMEDGYCVDIFQLHADSVEVIK